LYPSRGVGSWQRVIHGAEISVDSGHFGVLRLATPAVLTCSAIPVANPAKVNSATGPMAASSRLNVRELMRRVGTVVVAIESFGWV